MTFCDVNLQVKATARFSERQTIGAKAKALLQLTEWKKSPAFLSFIMLRNISYSLKYVARLVHTKNIALKTQFNLIKTH